MLFLEVLSDFGRGPSETANEIKTENVRTQAKTEKYKNAVV